MTSTTAAQALEALADLAQCAGAQVRPRMERNAATLRQHIESTAFELEALKHDVAHALMAATAEAEHADEVKAELEALRKDADRWRFITSEYAEEHTDLAVRKGLGATYGIDAERFVDAAIDAVLNQGGK